MSKAHEALAIPRRILVPTDFSESADAALEMATNLAQHFQAEIFLLNAIPVFPTTTAYDYFPETKFLEEMREYAEVQISRRQRSLVSSGIRVNHLVESGNDVASIIMAAVESQSVDMVVISTHGISGWRPFVFGSIAEKVVKLVQCPILLLRSKSVDTTS